VKCTSRRASDRNGKLLAVASRRTLKCNDATLYPATSLAYNVGTGDAERGLMSNSGNRQRPEGDFFVSYTEADRDWAEWVAWQIEAAGYSAFIQAWDFGPGTHFVEAMHHGAERSNCTVVILSRSYMDSTFAAEEWQAAWATDPSGRKGRLLILRVEDCDRPGLLRQMVSIDIFEVSQDIARERLLSALSRQRAKPEVEPAFPGPRRVTHGRPYFPGLPDIWNIPGRLATFTGRTELLRSIERALAQKPREGRSPTVAVTALRGLGGVGKTQLAIEYAWRNSHNYSVAWWIDAENVSLVPERLAALADPLDLPASGQVARDAGAVLDWLTHADRWLMIFDNAPTLQEIRRWLPTGTGHVLITSRHPAWKAVATRIDVDVMRRSEAVSLLRKHVQTVSPQVAAEISDELGDLPLALGQAAAYMEATEIPPETYLQRFRLRREQMIAQGTDLAYGRSLETAWSVTIDQLDNEEPGTVQLLRLAALCAPEPIPLTLFTTEPGLLPNPLSEALSDESTQSNIDNVVAAALAYSLCRRRGNAIQIHRLVQAAISYQFTPQKRVELTEILMCMAIAASPDNPDDPATWPSWSALGPHILHLSSISDPEKLSEFRYVIIEYCWYLFVRADYVTAHQIAENLYSKLSLSNGLDDPATLHAAANLTTILRSVGRVDEAQALAQDTLDRNRRLRGGDDPATLHAANNLVSSLWKPEDHHSAGKLAEDTLERCRRTLGEDDPLTLATAGNLAVLLSKLGQHRQARELAEDMAKRRQQLHGDDHRETMWAVGVLVQALRGCGDERAARQFAEQSLARHRRIFGDNHPSTRIAAEELASIKASLNKERIAREADIQQPSWEPSPGA
jgi:hypothetical protein